VRSPTRTLVLATRNANKAREIAAIYAHLGLEIRTLDEWPGIGELPEDGATYADNAVSKARAVADATGLVALADDSGIEIDALAGAPGVRSRRFLGEHTTDADRNTRVLMLLDHVPDAARTARYRAAVAVARPRGDVRVFEGICQGAVARRPRGRWGFGYDPIFIEGSTGRTMAELPPEAKNQISHRARALRAAEPYLIELLGPGRQEPSSPGANSDKVVRGAAPQAGGMPRPDCCNDRTAGGDR
jgi:XTP/dITP diphosphohydrolase